MSRSWTAEEIVDEVRRRAGMEHSEFVTDLEIIGYANQEAAELRSRLRRNEGQTHKRFRFEFSVTSAASEYDLPDDFWELLSVEAVIGGVNRRLKSFMENERAALTNATINVPYGPSPRYRIMGERKDRKKVIEFLPQTESFTAVLFYVPSEPRLRLGQVPPDVLDGYNGYEEAILHGTTARCIAKEDGDASWWMAQKKDILALIEANAAQRDAGAPERVTDVTGGLDSELWPWPRW